MQPFYFHLWQGGQLTADEVGFALPTFNAVKRHAESLASSILSQDHDDAPGSRLGWDIEVTDHAGRTVLLIPISGAQQRVTPKQAASWAA